MSNEESKRENVDFAKQYLIDTAKLCHEANKGYCECLGDFSQVDWDESPQWQKDSILNGVIFHFNDPDAKPGDSHKNWLKEKVENGWKFGLKKDEENKRHPCCVPYHHLSTEQQAKDYIFCAIVKERLRQLNELINELNTQ